MGKKVYRVSFKIECLHLDELPIEIKDIVKDNAPCVVTQKDQ